MEVLFGGSLSELVVISELCISAGQVQVNIRLLVGVLVLGFLELFGNQCVVHLESIKGVLWKANYLGVSLCFWGLLVGIIQQHVKGRFLVLP